MGKRSLRNYNKHNIKSIPNKLWAQISTGDPFNQSELCDSVCPNFKNLSKRAGKKRYSFNEGTCDITGEKVFAGSTLCPRSKESF